jgi:hypothetical protein
MGGAKGCCAGKVDVCTEAITSPPCKFKGKASEVEEWPALLVSISSSDKASSQDYNHVLDGVTVYWLNDKNRKDRRQYMGKWLKFLHANETRIDAVDAARVFERFSETSFATPSSDRTQPISSWTTAQAVNGKLRYKNATEGAEDKIRHTRLIQYAVTLGHILAAHKAKNDGARLALILEDDQDYRNAAEGPTLQELAQLQPQGWTAFQLNVHGGAGNHGWLETFRTLEGQSVLGRRSVAAETSVLANMAIKSDSWLPTAYQAEGRWAAGA